MQSLVPVRRRLDLVGGTLDSLVSCPVLRSRSDPQPSAGELADASLCLLWRVLSVGVQLLSRCSVSGFGSTVPTEATTAKGRRSASSRGSESHYRRTAE
ncbi:hypothetical protein GCM10009772_50500 [Pseudonocardia alni subsp. carboxydivorans]